MKKGILGAAVVAGAVAGGITWTQFANPPDRFIGKPPPETRLNVREVPGAVLEMLASDPEIPAWTIDLSAGGMFPDRAGLLLACEVRFTGAADCTNKLGIGDYENEEGLRGYVCCEGPLVIDEAGLLQPLPRS